MPGGMQEKRGGGDVGSANTFQGDRGDSDWLPRGVQGLRGEWSRGMHSSLAEGMLGECGESLRGARGVPGEQIWRMHGGLPGGNTDAQKKMQCRGMQGDAGTMRGLSLKGAVGYLRSRAGRMHGRCLRGRRGDARGNREHKG